MDISVSEEVNGLVVTINHEGSNNKLHFDNNFCVNACVLFHDNITKNLFEEKLAEAFDSKKGDAGIDDGYVLYILDTYESIDYITNYLEDLIKNATAGDLDESKVVLVYQKNNQIPTQELAKILRILDGTKLHFILPAYTNELRDKVFKYEDKSCLNDNFVIQNLVDLSIKGENIYSSESFLERHKSKVKK